MKIIQSLQGALKSVPRRIIAASLILSVLSWDTQAAPPPAGSSIGNQASATYTDGSGTQRTALSNVTLTFVQQIAALTLNQSQTKNASPGGQVTFPHTLVNTGNGNDAFTLATGTFGGAYTINNVQIFADLNGDGIPDNNTPITVTPTLANGATFKFVVVGNIPGGATAGQSGNFTVSATSVFNTGVSNAVANVDTANVSGGAVINVTKSISLGSGAAGTSNVVYTLTYNNSGNVASSNLTLVDLLPANLNYVTNSGRWSVSGATALTDAAGGDPAGINYDWNITAAGTVTAIITNVAPGQAGTLTFTVNISSNAPAGNIDNTVSYSYYDGANTVNGLQSNPARFTVIAGVSSVTITGQTNAVALEGASVLLTNVVKNTSAAVDTFNITIANGTFPAGTGFLLLKSDAATPLQDSNGDGIPDTGPLGAGASYNVVVKVILPASSASGPFTATKTATSVNNPAVSASTQDAITLVTQATVDLTASIPFNASAKGYGAGPEATAVVTNITNPGTIVIFTNYVNNTSASPDSYNLGTTVLPSGWSVSFKDSTGNVITTTGLVPASGSSTVYAYVTVPAGNAPGNNNVTFSVTSPTTGATDQMHDQVTVNSVRVLVISPNNTGEIVPGGAITYSHTIVNNGNVTEGGAFSTLNVGNTDSSSGWTSVIYYDVNGTGILATNDPVITSIPSSATIAPGASIKVIVKVFAPASAVAGQGNQSTLTVTTVNGSLVSSVPAVVSATDNTTVIASLLTLLKEQGLDATCSGTVSSYTTTNLASVAPGACIGYRLTALNKGSTTATNIVISDATPTFTTLSGSVTTTVGSVTTTPGTGNAGSIAVTVPSLAPGSSAVVTFEVKIQQ